MLFYYCRNCSHSAAILIDSHWTTNLIKFVYSTDSLFLAFFSFFFLAEQGAVEAVADLIHVQDMTGKVATTSEKKKGQL